MQGEFDSVPGRKEHSKKCPRASDCQRQRFTVALLPLLFRNNIPGHTSRVPQVGFELATDSIQFYAITNLEKIMIKIISYVLCVHYYSSYIEQPEDSCSAPALRHKRDFNIATAQRKCEAMQVFNQINMTRSSDTGLCFRRKCIEHYTTCIGS